jgi:hypothetical protein
MLLMIASVGEEVIGDSHILDSAAQLAIQVRNVMLNYAPIFTILTGFWGVIRFYFGFDPHKINFQKYVFYPLIMLFAIINYAWIMDTINTVAFDAVNCSKNEDSDKMFEKIMDAERQYTMIVSLGQMTYADTVINKKNEAVDAEYGDGSITGSIVKAKNWAVGKFNQYRASADFNGALTQTMPTPANIFDFLKGSLQAGFTTLCRSIIILLRKAIFMILLVVGPIAMTFEILPPWRGQFTHWLKIYISVILWGLTLNLIDACYVFYINSEYKAVFDDIAELAKNGEYYFSSTDSDFGYLSVVFALIYVFVPYITSIYSGGSGAGKMFTVLGGLIAKTAVSAASSVTKLIPSVPTKISGKTR